MNFSENISNKLTEIITNELDLNSDKKEIIAYAIENLLLFLLGVSSLVLLGVFSNALMAILVAAAFGGLLRRVSGGAHFNTPSKCLVFGSFIYTSIGILAKKMVEYKLFSSEDALYIILSICLIMIVLLAPVDSESKPINSIHFKRNLKMLSIVFIIMTFIVVYLTENLLFSVSAVMGVFYQCVTLLPIFNKKEVK
ncbi:accessory gene regulator ArgB-like protein [Desulfosporosinus hippei]|uniref:Accessory gene regulator B n=1 Tax=Desulfosporosinus hippei DSM 8344 TaxID=1121419 RepID=A0A1G8AMK4_9FIRM|nr:accessory gene regulator B family protein [Desulfosporosinus hippei]SDH22147.1 accessory gene regulator B [Desulfosporosinus hippei DSM 8344]